MEHQPPHRGSCEPRQALSTGDAADTVVAAATPPGRGGIAIVRLSGARVPDIAHGLLGSLPVPRLATRTPFLNAAAGGIDDGLALYFPAPDSYTGEHVLELQGHGGPVVVEALIARALELGARRAAPGEFTRRAYLNGKLDLAQAEAVADLIDAASEAGARAALRSLQGEFSAQVRALGDAMGALRVQIEAAIDFSDEDIETLSEPALCTGLTAAAAQLEALLASCRSGRALTEGLTVVIAGAPNAGKSTLLNRLAGHEAAIVTPIPGTTRDVLRERILIDGVPVLLLDTAGLRDATDDAIEAEGMRRAQAAMAGADRILFVIDAAADPHCDRLRRARGRLPAQVPVTVVLNKMDLVAADAAAAPADLVEVPLRISAQSGEGLDALRQHLLTATGLTVTAEGTVSARARHVEALHRCADCLGAAVEEQARGGGRELIAEELRRAQLALAELLGEQSSDELLGRIFSSFCIGK
ncbi:MAG: tRNA uridine-5-carboxymethylaminomethyl(34) synthesis GTPase MnmE [Steroidobacteraceae bacterium]